MEPDHDQPAEKQKHHLDLPQWIEVLRQVRQVALQLLLVMQLAVAVLIVLVQIVMTVQGLIW